MESSLVNARVPLAKKEAGAEILASLGATTTELINCAYDYLIECKALPSLQRNETSSTSFSSFVNNTTFAVDWSDFPENKSYKDIIKEGKQAEYERLA